MERPLDKPTEDDLAEEKTSVRAAVPMLGGGTCVLVGFPGLRAGIDGVAYIDPEHIELTLLRLKDMRAEICLLLPEATELPDHAVTQVFKAIELAGIKAIHMPICDFAAPDAAFMEHWAAVRDRLHALLDRGGTMAVTCQYGAGRSGLVTALLLIERGMECMAAISHVRAHFDEAVESDVQVAWLTAKR